MYRMCNDKGEGGGLFAYLRACVCLVEDGQRSSDHQAQFLEKPQEKQRLMDKSRGPIFLRRHRSCRRLIGGRMTASKAVGCCLIYSVA